MSTPLNPEDGKKAVTLIDGTKVEFFNGVMQIWDADDERWCFLALSQGKAVFDTLSTLTRENQEKEQEIQKLKEALEESNAWLKATREAHEGMRQHWWNARKRAATFHRRAQIAEGKVSKFVHEASFYYRILRGRNLFVDALHDEIDSGKQQITELKEQLRAALSQLEPGVES